MKHLPFLALTLLFLTSGCASGPERSVEQIVSEEVASLQSNEAYEAVSVALHVDGNEYTFHFGTLHDGTTPTDATLYEIGSLTKTYTGLILAQAVKDELVELDDPIANYLPNKYTPNFVRDGRVATLRDLATHTSGLPVNLACNEANLSVEARLACYKNYSRAHFFEALTKTSILDTPGVQYRYSNAGIRLLSHILEDVYGEQYPDLLDRIVFRGSGEADTLFRLGPDDEDRLAKGKDQAGKLMPAASEYYFGAGALKTTTDSFLNHIAFYLESNDPLIETAIMQIAGEKDGLGRAYVWNTFRYASEGMLYHAGGTFGTSSWVALYPKEEIGVFLVTPFVSADAQNELNGASNRIVERLRDRKK